MNSRHRDVTLHALSRLPAAATEELESALAADPDLAGELRSNEDAIAAIWQASAPLTSAPAGHYAGIREKIATRAVLKPRILPILATLGWAAALVMGAFLMLRPAVIRPIPTIGNARNPVQQPGRIDDFGEARRSADRSVVPRRAENSSKNRMEASLRLLQAELSAARRAARAPRVRELRAPGAARGMGGIDERDRDQEVGNLLREMLTENLARAGEAPSTLVVENGWIEQFFAALPEGALVRHRNFPADEFARFGLLRAESGDFYDPAAGLVWSPAADGGGFLGQRPAPGFDASGFSPGEMEPIPPVAPSIKSAPSGFLVQSGSGENAEEMLVIGNLEPQNGAPPELFASTDGGVTTVALSVNGYWPSQDGSLIGNFSVPITMSSNSAGLSSLGSGPLTILRTDENGGTTVILTEAP